MDAFETNRASLRDFLYLIFKRKSQLLVFFAATVLTVAVGTLLTTPTYEAESQILVKIGRENLYVPTVPASVNQNPVISINREEQINSEIEILMSRALLMKIAESMGPATIYDDIESPPGWFGRMVRGFGPGKQEEHRFSPLQEAVQRLQKDLTVEAVKKSNVIDVKLKHQDPQMAATVLNRVIVLYMDHHLEVYKSPQSYKFFQDQSQILLGKLKAAENRLETFQKQHNVSSLEEERKLLLAQEGALRADLNRTQSQIAETENRLGQIQKHLASTPKTIPTEQEVEHSPFVINTLQARLMELELKEKEYLAKYSEDSRWAQNVREEIRVVRQKLTEQEEKRFGKTRSGLNTTYQRMEEELYRNQAEFKALKAKEEAQSSQVAVYRERLEKLNRIEVELKGLQRQVDVDQQNYRLYLTKFEESRISEAMDTEKMTNVTQIEPATPPLKPVRPKVLVNMVLGILLGLFGGLALAFFTEYLDDSITRPEDAEAFSLPVLACIPQLMPVGVPQTSRRMKVSPLPSVRSHFSVLVISGLAVTLGAFIGLWFYSGDHFIRTGGVESASKTSPAPAVVIASRAPDPQEITTLDDLPEIHLSGMKAPLKDTKAFPKEGVSEGEPHPNKTETGGTVNEIAKKAAKTKPTERPDSVPSETAKPSISDQRIRMIQVGAFRNKEVALEQAAALQQKGYDAHMVAVRLDDTGTIYRVRILSYEDLETTTVTIKKLMDHGFDAFVVSGNKG